jgi:fibro-slime domain-containing protein
MNILPRKIYSISVCVSAILLAACSGESSQSSSESSSGLALAKDTPIAYVERSVSQTAEANESRFEQARESNSQTPLELYSPYHYNPGAKLKERSGIDVDAVSNELLSDYFQSSAYDVKDLNVSPDGQYLIFAARGPVTHPTDYTWNIYEYDFDTKVIRRIIADDTLANKRSDGSDAHDTNPVYDRDGNIIFSSNRAAGNPNSPVPNIIPVEDAEFCSKVTPKEDPSLLHSMTSTGANILQLTYGQNHDTNPAIMKDGRITFVRWSYTYLTEEVEHCEQLSPKASSTQDLLRATSSDTPTGMNRPDNWSADRVCNYKEVMYVGNSNQKTDVLFTNNYTLLRITPDGESIEQLYETVSIKPSDEQLVSLDKIVQSENGQLAGVLRHKVNNTLGGNIIELGSPNAPNGKMFGNIAPRSLVEGEVQIRPGFLSKNGWYSALWPYRDGSSRYMVSWTQCLVDRNGVSKFCRDIAGDDELNSQYGLWVFDADDNTRLPVVQAQSDRVFEDVVLGQAHVGLEFPFEPYNPDFVDNLDDSQIICNYPEPENNAPIANAGADQSVYTGSLVSLDGSASSDIDGDPISYLWSISSQPSGSSVSLSDNTSPNPTFTASQAGSYTFQLVVNDGELNSAADSVTINAADEVVNSAPVANAGDDKATLVGVAVALDGSGSSDVDNDSLSYQWSIISPDGADISIISDATSAQPSITPPDEGVYIVQLVVNDGQLSSAPDTVSVIANYPNRAPVANAGDNQQLFIGSSVTLNGLGSSDPDGDPLSYAWTVISPEGVVLSNANTATPGITVNQYGSYVIQLIVNDGELNSEPDSVTLEVVNRKPVANAGPDTTYDNFDPVTLDGSLSFDPEEEALTYRWEFASVPNDSSVSLSNSTAQMPVFTPDASGVYVIELVVNDGSLDSDADQVSITVDNVPNNAPVANAGPDQQISIGGTYMLDGSASSDADSDPLTYLWTVVSPEGISISDPTSVRPDINISEYGSYVIQLVVNDGTVDSQPDTVSLEFDNVKPVAEAGADQSVAVGTTVELNGSGSTDVNGDPLTYTWTLLNQPDGSTASLSNADTMTPTLVTDQQGSYVVQLVVNDGLIDSDPDTVTVTSPNTTPIADAGDDVSVSLGSSTELDGSGSSDPDNDPLTYRWSLLSTPDDSLASLVNTTSVNPTLQGVDVYGDYIVQLIVNDGTEDSAPDTVVLSSQNLPPVADAGDDINIDFGQDAMLDGSGSADPQGDEITYSWSLISTPDGSSVSLDDNTAITPGFTPDVEGTYVAQLIVNDGELSSDPDTVEIQAQQVACVIDDINERTFPVTIRDFTVAHPDFEAYVGNGEKGIVESELGDDGLPVYAHGEDGTRLTSGLSAFNQWYRDVPGVNYNIPLTLTMTREPNTVNWSYSNSEFFPINDDLLPDDVVSWGNTPIAVAQGLERNYHFTMEVRLEFDYQGGEMFSFTGDDDLWVFINGKLAVDLGGVQDPGQDTINLDEMADELGIEPGNHYSFDLFFAERKLHKSNFNFETSINLDCVVP